MKAILTCLMACCLVGSTFAIGNYQIDDAALEAQFEAATEKSMMTVDDSWDMAGATSGVQKVSHVRGERDPMVAAIIAYVQYAFALWWLPIHRIYLGTSGGTIAAYILTCGGFGVLPLIDGLVLLIDDDPYRFIDNSKFLMWAGQ
ncbi:MAG: TM2 domain-containing protein [Salibacteraceae bacterium]